MANSTSVDLELEYANPAQMEEFLRTVGNWERESAAYRDALGERATLDIAYGSGPAQRFDLFAARPGVEAAPRVALFIHGGYWQSMGKSSFSHLARGANELGVTVAAVGHTLSPEAKLADMVLEVADAAALIEKTLGKQVVAYGHSSGGHLAACALPCESVVAALTVSGLFEVEPVNATSIGGKLGLTAADARAVSPRTWAVLKRKPVRAFVGGLESSEFRRQSREFVDYWKAGGGDATFVEVAGATHFTVIEGLTDPESAMSRALAALCR
jgi:arylformamidase